MTRADLLALAARVEAADGADRGVDAEIVWRTTPGIVGIERGPLDGGGTGYLFEWEPRRLWADSWRYVPAFTSSLDAAASLVPAGVGFTVSSIPKEGRHYAFTSEGPDHPLPLCATPALALTAAALRAMAEEAGE